MSAERPPEGASPLALRREVNPVGADSGALAAPEGPAAAGPDVPLAAQRPQPLDSDALLRGRRIVEIAHNGEVYRLQATRHGKLILTK